MMLAVEILNCVCFVGSHEILPDGQPGVRFRGTGFFVEQDSRTIPGRVSGYLVTVRHVAERIRPEEFHVRVNTTDGESAVVQGHQFRWWTHPTDPTADVAVLQWFPAPDRVQYKRVNTSIFATGDTIADGTIGVGDEVFVSGLFGWHIGSALNQPIVRTGTIAMIPDEPVASTRLGPMEVYLIEARSIGGLSGSPMFALAKTQHAMGMSSSWDSGRLSYSVSCMDIGICRRAASMMSLAVGITGEHP